jgi:hypothetical protein
MAKSLAEKIENTRTEIKQSENRLKQLIQEQKTQERKDRTRRLCKRAGLLESLLPETIPLTEEQFKTFLEKAVLSNYSRRIVTSLSEQGATTTATQTSHMVAPSAPSTANNPDVASYEYPISSSADLDAGKVQTR